MRNIYFRNIWLYILFRGEKGDNMNKNLLAWALVALLALGSIFLGYDDIRIRVKIAYHENYAKGFKDASLYLTCQQGVLPSQEEIEILKTVDVGNCRDVEKVIAKSSTWSKPIAPADMDGNVDKNK